MFDIGFSELLLIGVVALIVVGPKDLPGMFRTLGRFTARARQMGREFSQAMNDAADESGAKDIADTFKSATSSKAMGLDALNKAADGFEKWDPAKSLRDKTDDDPTLKSRKSDPETAKKDADAARQADMLKVKTPPSKRPTERTIGQPDDAAAPANQPATKPEVSKPAGTRKAAPKKPAAKKADPNKPTAASKAKAKAKPTDTSDG
ncbi:Sec-independent protein translocase protein TatB [Aliiroseovarius sediminis]|uniref:Sec-independent protein translocase protein TatB n=1 Tax=Aliiroseovarius sediminis TaxID=2925839 RepID=UPI001F5A9879|nr:Sec-independent protein translocase protein TatB [Aliiroseovarius sediminis]MCI2394528.1 Sec-independent protein translocase protein TatB [Aliiroseovarius sediminis]